MTKLVKMLISLVGAFCVCASAHAYTLRVDNTDHGSVRLSKTSASAGDTVSLLVLNDEGYWVDHMVIMDSREDVLPIQWDAHNMGINRYYITMPACDITIRPCFRVFAPVGIRTTITNGRLSVDWERGYMENEWEVVISEGDAIAAKEKPMRVSEMHYEQELRLNTQYTMLIRAWLDEENYSDWVNVGNINGPACQESYHLLLDDYSYQGNVGWIEAVGHDGEVLATYRVPQGQGSAEFDLPTGGVARYVYRKGPNNDIFRFYFYTGSRCLLGPNGFTHRYVDGETIYEPYDCNQVYCPMPFVESLTEIANVADSALLTIDQLTDSVEVLISDHHQNAAACNLQALTSGYMMHGSSIPVGGIRRGHVVYVFSRSYCGEHVSDWREQRFLLQTLATDEVLSPAYQLYDQTATIPMSETGLTIDGGVVDDNEYAHRYYRLSLAEGTFFTPQYESNNDGDDQLIVATNAALTQDAISLPTDSLVYLPAGNYYMALHDLGNWQIYNPSGTLEPSTYSFRLIDTEALSAPQAINLDHEEEGDISSRTEATLYENKPYHMLRRTFSLNATAEVDLTLDATNGIMLLNGTPVANGTQTLAAGSYTVSCLMPTGAYRLAIGRHHAVRVVAATLPFSQQDKLSMAQPNLVYAITAPCDTTLQIAMDYAADEAYAFGVYADSLCTNPLLLQDADRLAHLSVEAGHTYYIKPTTPDDYLPYRLSMRYVPQPTLGQFVLLNDSIHAYWQPTHEKVCTASEWYERKGYVFSILLTEATALQPIEALWGSCYLIQDDYNWQDEIDYYEADTLVPGVYNLYCTFDETFYGEALDLAIRPYSPFAFDDAPSSIQPIQLGDTVLGYLHCDHPNAYYKLRLTEPLDGEVRYVLNNDDLDVGFTFSTDSMEILMGEYWGPANLGCIYHVGEAYITLPADTDIYVGLINYHGDCDVTFSWKLQQAYTYRTLNYQPISNDTIVAVTFNRGMEPIMSGRCDQRDQCYNRIKGFDFYNSMTRGYSLTLQAGHTYHITATFRPEEYGWTTASLVLLTPDGLTGHLDTIPADDVVDYRDEYTWTAQIGHQIVFTADRDGVYPLLLACTSETAELFMRLIVREDPTEWQTLTQLLAASESESIPYEDLPQYNSGSFTTSLLPIRSDSLFCYGTPQMVITETYLDSIEQEATCWNYDLQEDVTYTYMIATGDPIVDTTYVTPFDGVHYAVARAIVLQSGDQWTATATSLSANLLMIFYRDHDGRYVRVACSNAATTNQFTGIAQHTTTYYAVLTTEDPLEQTTWNLTLSKDRYSYLLNPAFGLSTPHISLLGSTNSLTFTHMPSEAEWRSALQAVTFTAKFGDVASLDIPNIADDWTIDSTTMQAVYHADANWLYGEYEWDDAGGVHTIGLRVEVGLQSVDTLLTLYAIPTEQDLRSVLNTVRLEITDDHGVVLRPTNHPENWVIDLDAMSGTYTAPNTDLPLGFHYRNNTIHVRVQVETELTAGQESIELTTLPSETVLSQQVRRVRLYADARGEQVAALTNNPAQWMINTDEMEVNYTAFDRELPYGYIFAAGKNTISLPVSIYLSNLSVKPDRYVVVASDDQLAAIQEALSEIVITLYAGTTPIATLPNNAECWIIDSFSRVASYICPADILPQGYYNTGKQLRTAVEYTIAVPTALPDVMVGPASQQYYRLGIWLLHVSDGKKEIILGD